MISSISGTYNLTSPLVRLKICGYSNYVNSERERFLSSSLRLTLATSFPGPIFDPVLRRTFKDSKFLSYLAL